MINASKTKIPDFKIEWREGSWLETSFTEPVLEVVAKRHDAAGVSVLDSLTYYTDSLGETNGSQGDGADKPVGSKSKWDGKKIVIKYVTNSKEKEINEEWSVSSDGNQLTRKMLIKLTTTVTLQFHGVTTNTQTHTAKSELIFVYDRKATP